MIYPAFLKHEAAMATVTMLCAPADAGIDA
jgi:hypothetical protein